MNTLRVDVAVIGAGTAGLTARREANKLGAAVLLIEGGQYGTTCARVGCMPSKLLIAAADAAHHVRTAGTFGIRVPDGVRVDGPAVLERVRRERDRFVGFVLASVEAVPPAQRLRGHARFVGPSTLQVDDHTRVEAKAVVVATGSSASVPPALQGVRDHLLVSDDVFELHDLPRSLAVIGTGVIGLELGQAMHRLGVQTTFFSRSEHLGPLTDPMLRVEAASILGAELDLQLSSEPAVTRSADGFHVAWTDAAGRQRKARFDALLCATGRRANLDGLDLLRAGVATVPAVDPHTLQLGNLPIFFAGDAGAYRPVLHEAAHEGIIAGINAARYPDVQAHRRRTPLEIVFTRPEMAIVGTPYSLLDSAETEAGTRVLRQPGTRPRHGRERGPGAHLRAAQVRHADRRRDVRPARRAHRPPAGVGRAARRHRQRGARDAGLSPGHRGRDSHRAARSLHQPEDARSRTADRPRVRPRRLSAPVTTDLVGTKPGTYARLLGGRIRMRSISLSAAALAVLAGLTMVPRGAGAADPSQVCEKIAGKTLVTCVKKVNKIQGKCYEDTGVACLGTDPDIGKALDKVAKKIAKKCPSDAIVQSAGYGPLMTVAGLTARLQSQCRADASSLASRTFGGPRGAALGAQDAAGKACLSTLHSETAKLLVGQAKAQNGCVDKQRKSGNCDLTKTNDKIAGLETKALEKIGAACGTVDALATKIAVSTPQYLDRAAAQARCLTAIAHPDSAPLGLDCGPRADLIATPRGDYVQVVLDQAETGALCGDGSHFAFWIRLAPEGAAGRERRRRHAGRRRLHLRGRLQHACRPTCSRR